MIYRIAGKERIGGFESRSSNQTKPDAPYVLVKSKTVALMNDGFYRRAMAFGWDVVREGCLET